MTECPYCGTGVADEDRYCPRCGERLSDLDSRAGFLSPGVVTYLDGVRNGARTFDPDSPYHDRFERELAAAVGDFAHLAGVDLDLAGVLDLDDAPPRDASVDPPDADPPTRRLLGVAVVLGLAAEAFPETGVDELLTTYHAFDERT